MLYNYNREEMYEPSARKTLAGGMVLALFSVLAQYDLPLMSYGLVLALLYSVFFILFRRTICINKSMLVFIVFASLQQAMMYGITNTFGKNRNTYLFMFVCLFLLVVMGQIDKNHFIKAYSAIGVVLSCIVLYQFVRANLFGILQSSIQILPVAEADQHFWIKNSNRVSGLFTEPQGYCSYIIPLLIMLLFRKRYKSAVFISAAIIASTSSQGIILMAYVWMYYLIIYERRAAIKAVRTLIFAVCGIAGCFILSRLPSFSFIIDKILSINIFGYDIRLTKGFQIYFAMPLLDKITGIGFGNLREYLLNGGFSFFWMKLTKDTLFAYITTMSNVLVSFGIFGFIFYINVFRENLKTARGEARLMLFVILISSFTQTILFNAWFVFSWIVFEVVDDKRNRNYWNIRFVFGGRGHGADRNHNDLQRCQLRSCPAGICFENSAGGSGIQGKNH